MFMCSVLHNGSILATDAIRTDEWVVHLRAVPDPIEAIRVRCAVVRRQTESPRAIGLVQGKKARDPSERQLLRNMVCEPSFASGRRSATQVLRNGGTWVSVIRGS